MRRLITAYSVATLLIGLVCGPLFHFHAAGDGSHGHDEAAELHAHGPEEHEHSAPSQPEVETPHEGHHGIEMSVFVSYAPEAQPLLLDLETTAGIVEPLPLTGCVLAPLVQAHDPPDRRNSSPRSPPA